MAHTPYGYKIVDGKAVINEEQAEIVRKLFEGYISGLALKVAAENAGLHIYHGSAGRMLRNKHYLGDDYYPAIIDRNQFEQAEEIRVKKAETLGRIREQEAVPKASVCTSFSIKTVTKKYADPFKQAEYAYSLIESKVTKNE